MADLAQRVALAEISLKTPLCNGSPGNSLR